MRRVAQNSKSDQDKKKSKSELKSDNRPLLRGQWRPPGRLACWPMAAGWSPRGPFIAINGPEIVGWCSLHR